jgi:hypothetical protein
LATPITSLPEYQEWFREQNFSPIDDSEIKKKLFADLNLGKSLTQKEYVLWRNWDQLHSVFGEADKKTLQKIKNVKKKIWKPKDPDDYLNLEPEVVLAKHQFPIRSVSIWGHERFDFYTNPDPLSEDYEILRFFVSTMPHGGNVGRSLRFLVRDRRSKKYLGILCLSGDFLDLKGRDDAIGWSSKVRVDEQMIKHTAIGSVIVPTQPFGFNYVGGKLLSLLLVSDAVTKAWEQVYGRVLAGVTTTSLYGTQNQGTQYDGLKYWKNYGNSSGSTVLRPTEKTSDDLRTWLHSNYPEKYWKYFVAKRPGGLPLERNSNERARQFCYRKLGILPTEFTSSHTRGIYFCRLYNNSFEFLRKEIEQEKLSRRFDNSTDSLVSLWKDKYAFKRIENLKRKNVFSTDVAYYDELLSLSWGQTKERYQ